MAMGVPTLREVFDEKYYADWTAASWRAWAGSSKDA
jgi:hypothetical protein